MSADYTRTPVPLALTFFLNRERNTGSEKPIATPMLSDRRNGLYLSNGLATRATITDRLSNTYPLSISRGRHPRMYVSRVTTRAENPAFFARDKIDAVISSSRGYSTEYMKQVSIMGLYFQYVDECAPILPSIAERIARRRRSP